MNRQSRTDKWVYVGGTIVRFVAAKRDTQSLTDTIISEECLDVFEDLNLHPLGFKSYGSYVYILRGFSSLGLFIWAFARRFSISHRNANNEKWGYGVGNQCNEQLIDAKSLRYFRSSVGRDGNSRFS